MELQKQQNRPFSNLRPVESVTSQDSCWKLKNEKCLGHLRAKVKVGDFIKLTTYISPPKVSNYMKHNVVLIEKCKHSIVK